MLRATGPTTHRRWSYDHRMALRDKLHARIQPMLEPGETIQNVWMMQSGMSPYFMGGLGAILFIILNKYYVVAATDQNVVLLKANKLIPSKPKALLERLPRSTRFDISGRLWGKANVGGTNYYVNRRFFKDVEAANTRAVEQKPW